ncbi:MAG: hypothetical protein IJI36_14690, partial [Kiritimatiellae bacterium]|nr:hypothetical protein [Kiritimatiellia bacterium]
MARLTQIATFAVFCSSPCIADDAVGVMRVSVPSNDAAVVEMPFAPFAAAGPTNFLSGPFTGDGGPQSDVVYMVPR